MIFKNRKVLITGHTGFKGSWLSACLSNFGAEVYGLSDNIPTKPSHYELLDNISKDYWVDIRDSKAVNKVISDLKPDFIFHLAAQPIVLESYKNPFNTFQTNIIWTANILESLRLSNHKCTSVIITSDKSYDNIEWVYGYRESDPLGGKDPYSGSKGAAELVIKSYVESFFNKNESNIRVAVARAGNVIGGGDWAKYRIIPDCMRSWSMKSTPEIRSPLATRPWQHVLEPLGGYLTLSYNLYNHIELNGEAFNFGPPAHQNHTVEDLVNEILNYWPGHKWKDKSANNTSPPEAGLLKLNCDKALNLIDWKATLSFEETAKWTGEWYYNYYYEDPKSVLKFTNKQIKEYFSLAKNRGSFSIG